MFIAYLNQGQSCGHTIGCGVLLVELEATTYEAAVNELREEYLYQDEVALETITLYEVIRKEEMPVEAWYADEERRAREEDKRKQEEAERQAYDRLRAKYEGR